MDKLFFKLNNIINYYEKFIIMAHANPDLDAIGSSLAFYSVLKSMEKDVSIFIDIKNLSKYNDTVVKALTKVDEINYIYRLDNILSDNTLLIILDVHQQKRLECPEILDKNLDVLVLDHHIKNKNYIKDTIFTYIDSNLSSMVEMMAKYIKYNDIKIDSIISSIMLAGLEIDTNNYNLKTTKETYLAASILMDNGADIILKQELLKETKEEYIKRADYIKNSFRVNDHIAMCVLVDELKTEELAEIADEMLNFNDVEASFAISYISSDIVGISARSLGNIDVQKIMKKFNGGGSKTNAAAQCDMEIRDIKYMLIKMIG